MSIISPSGPLTLTTVVSHLAALDAVGDKSEVTIDLSKVTDVDSSAVALLVNWCRAAQMRQITLRFSAIPEGLSRLLAVYGLTEILPLAD